MVAKDEYNDLDFRRFANNPTVTVEYDTIPVVSSASTSPNTAVIGHTTVTLNAYVTDADAGAPIQAKFALTGKNASGQVIYTSGSQPVEPSNTVTNQGGISWYVGYLPTGTYTWTAQADDGKYLSPVKTSTFTVDSTKPDVPTISSTTFPQGGTGPFRTPGDFVFTAPTNLPTGIKITKYAYNWGTPPPTVNPPLTVNADSSGNATVTLTPGGYIHDVLYVYAIDSAGNQSDSQNYWFNTASPLTADLTGDFSGGGKPDLVTPGADGNLRLYTNSGTGHLNAPINLTTGGGFTGSKIVVGAFAGGQYSGAQGVLAINSSGGAYIYFGNGDAEPIPADIPAQNADLSSDSTFTWSQVIQVAGDDSQYNQASAPNQPNLWAITSDGKLWWIPSTFTSGSYDTPVQLGTDWQNKTLAYAGIVGGFPALWVRDTVTGELDLYTGDANTIAGAATSTKTVSPVSGWTTAAHPALYSAGGANTGTGNPDLWATDSQAVHNVSYYPAGNTAGTVTTGSRVQTLNPSDDFTGNGNAGMVAEWPDGTLHIYTSQPGGSLTGGQQIWDSSWGSMKLMVSGDFNSDGKADVVGEWPDGSMHLYPGTGTGGLDTGPAAGKQLYGGTTWGTTKQIVSGDFNGDGRTDLVSIWGDGTLHLYTNNGNGDLNPSTQLWPDNSWSGIKLLAAGDYTSDGNADLLAEWPDGTLHSYIGDGNGHLTTGKPMIGGNTWTTVSHIIPGDFSGDGKTDLSAIWGDGSIHLYNGDGQGNLTSGVTMWPDKSWLSMKLVS